MIVLVRKQEDYQVRMNGFVGDWMKGWDDEQMRQVGRQMAKQILAVEIER